MKRYWLAAIFAAFLFLSACSTADPTPVETASAPAPETVLIRANPLPVAKSDFFAGSGTCASCHRDMVDEGGQDVSSDRLWRSTMMANSARDPYWQAAVRAEGLANPALREVIEDKCTTCHTPMARFTEVHSSASPVLATFFDGGYSDPNHNLHVLGMDGVSCTLCHQIESLGLGELSSFSGGYAINPDLAPGNRINYGPYVVAPEEAERMRAASGFTPVYGEHMSESEVCATCHGLFTPTLDAHGEIVGEFPEQMVYLEWLHSLYRDSISCQGCHMPVAEGGVRLSITGGELRQPFFLHYFVGGNAYLPRIFQAFGNEMGVTASTEQFETTIQNAEQMIGTRSALVNIASAEIQDSQLVAEIEIRSMVGHKFPSGFPSRRTWLHVTVLDAAGAVVFESGGYNATGAILGNDNDEDALRYEPHYTLIDSPDQVQIYEAIMHNTDGELTTILLRGAGYTKDNRLLPAGFDKMTAPPDIAVYGNALQDDTFTGGGDRIRYQVALGEAAGPFTLQVELLYQTLGFRWADNLRAYTSEETSRFIRYYESVPNLPLTAARAEARDLR
jgi:hypothetical protein